MEIGLIGINRYAKYLNFACDLHIYAFQQFLDQHGYSSTVLDYKPAYFDNFNMRKPAKQAERKYRDAVERGASGATLDKLAEMAMGYRSAPIERERRYDKFEAFVENNLRFTEEKYDSDVLEVQDPGFDCYICVTDVIWQSISEHTFDRGFLLGSKAFEGKQKISYAASRGASKDFNDTEREKFFDYLQDIESISVRERDFAEYIETNSEYTAEVVMDPVMLHGKDFWSNIATKPKEEKYLVLYYVMERSTDTIAKAVEYAKLHDLTIVELSDRPLKYGKITDPDVKHVPRYDIGMEEWLGYIEHADAVFTNSFHGCCFSILFEKPIFVGRRNGQKVPNFLATFDLSDRRFEPDADVSEFSLEIDYAAVNAILEKERKKSSDFILDALAQAKQRVESGETKDVARFESKRRELSYPYRFHSGGLTEGVTLNSNRPAEVKHKRTSSGATEYATPDSRLRNDGHAIIPKNLFKAKGHEFVGWTLRFRIDNRWFWCLDDGSIGNKKLNGEGIEDRKQLFTEGATIPHLPVSNVAVAVLVAEWRELPEEREIAPTEPESRRTRIGRLLRRG